MRLVSEQERNEPKPHGGIALYPFIQHFNLTFGGKTRTTFREFLQANSKCQRWLMLSDYAFYDQNKNSDVATFTFVPLPLPSSFDDLVSRIQAAAPTDLKHSSQVRPEFISLIKDNPTFSVSVILDRERKMSAAENTDLKRDLKMLRQMVETWKSRGDPTTFPTIAKDLRTLGNALSRNGVNMRLVRDLMIVSNLAGYLAFQFQDVLLLAELTWATDRDSMHSFLLPKCSNSLFHTLADLLSHSLCEREGLSTNFRRFTFETPEPEGPLRYDALLRIPDLICGTLADMRAEIGQRVVATHKKFNAAIDGLLADEKSQAILTIQFDTETHEPRAFRSIFETTNGAPVQA